MLSILYENLSKYLCFDISTLCDDDNGDKNKVKYVTNCWLSKKRGTTEYKLYIVKIFYARNV